MRATHTCAVLMLAHAADDLEVAEDLVLAGAVQRSAVARNAAECGGEVNVVPLAAGLAKECEDIGCPAVLRELDDSRVCFDGLLDSLCGRSPPGAAAEIGGEAAQAADGSCALEEGGTGPGQSAQEPGKQCVHDDQARCVYKILKAC